MPTLFETKNGNIARVSTSPGIMFQINTVEDVTATNSTATAKAFSLDALLTSIITSDNTRDNIMYSCEDTIFVSSAGAAVGSLTMSGLAINFCGNTQNNKVWAGTLRNKFEEVRVGNAKSFLRIFPKNGKPEESLEFLPNGLRTTTTKNTNVLTEFTMTGYLFPSGYKPYFT